MLIFTSGWTCFIFFFFSLHESDSGLTPPPVHPRHLASHSLLQIKAWEEAEMDKPMEIDEIRIDPSPFQLVERTSLHKVGGGREDKQRSEDVCGQTQYMSIPYCTLHSYDDRNEFHVCINCFNNSFCTCISEAKKRFEHISSVKFSKPRFCTYDQFSGQLFFVSWRCLRLSVFLKFNTEICILQSSVDMSR